MKRFLPLFFLILYPYSLFSKNSIDSILTVLDKTVKESQFYSNQKEARVKKLLAQQQTIKKDLQLYTNFHQLYKEYQSYKYDSAHAYAGRMLQLAEKLNDPNLMSESKIAQAFSCISSGLYKEAAEITNSIDSVHLSPENKAELYNYLSVSNINMGDFSGTEPYRSNYRAVARQYAAKSLRLFSSKSAQALMAQVRFCQLDADYSKAIALSEQYLCTGKPDLHNKAIISSTLGYFYEVQKDTTQAMICFAMGAIADIQSATKETTAIRQLAELLFAKGDVQRAYTYATYALDDANFYNARQRKIEVGQILPIIEAGRFQIIKQQKDRLLIYLGLISVLLILFLMATIIILKQKKSLNFAQQLIIQQNKDLQETNKQLTDIQKAIEQQNSDLTLINDKLKEAHHIKDEYIGYFFSTNSVYLEKMDEYRKMVARKLRGKQYDELAQLATQADLRKEREEMFALFDRIFINLFPDFVSRYNELFNTEDCVELKDGMLTPEIRIFALIRLGISESERIARFLDFSLSTVKNYKTKAKNRSLIPNELFETKIMEIESVKQ